MEVLTAMRDTSTYTWLTHGALKLCINNYIVSERALRNRDQDDSIT